MRRMIPWLLSLSLSVGALTPAYAQLPEQTYESANFSLTVPASYTDRGAIDRTLEAFEEAHTFLVTVLGYLPPPVSGKYHLYGGAEAMGVVRPAPGGSGGSDASFIVLPLSDLEYGPNALRTLAVHEYFHALQLGYNGHSAHWIQEASSAWVEGVFVEGNNNHIYVPYFVPFPRVSLDDVGGVYEYGAFLFLQYLVERFGDVNIVREVWEEMAVPAAVPDAPNRDPFDAIAVVLERRGVTVPEAWGEFQMWRLHLGAHFAEGSDYARTVKREAEWPSFLRRSIVRTESCRLDTDADGIGLPPLSGDYVRLEPAKKGPARTTAQLAVDGPPESTGFYVLKPRRTPAQEVSLAFDQDGVAIAEVPFGRSEVARLTVGLANGAISGARETIGYSLRLRGANRVSMSGISGPSATDFGTGIALSGSVECGGRPAPFADIMVTAREVDSGTELTFRVQTDEFGRWTLRTTPEANSEFSAEVDDPLISEARTDSIRVNVRVVVTVVIAEDRIPAGSPAVLSGQVQPAHSGVDVVVQYRRPGRDWTSGPTVQTNVQGGYTAQLELPETGIWEVRTRVDDTEDEDHVGNLSGTRLIEVVG